MFLVLVSQSWSHFNCLNSGSITWWMFAYKWHLVIWNVLNVKWNEVLSTCIFLPLTRIQLGWSCSVSLYVYSKCQQEQATEDGGRLRGEVRCPGPHRLGHEHWLRLECGHGPLPRSVTVEPSFHHWIPVLLITDKTDKLIISVENQPYSFLV